MSIAMTTNDDAMVLVDFEVNRRDLFRANLELAKWRLLIGIVVVLVLSSALVYFFVLIDEKEILLQTSPLFIGVPIVALAGHVLRLHATSRKYIASLTPSQRQLTYMFRSDSDGYDSAAGESTSHTVWKDVMSVVEKPGYFLLYQNRFQIGVLPKRGFEAEDVPVFRGIVRSELGEEAKVFSDQT
jgi:hypothetical protein